MAQLKVRKGRTEIVSVKIGQDISADTFASEIRAEPEQSSTLIATWAVSFLTDGTDGELILTLDDVITAQITATSGYMDIKRVTGGEPVAVFDSPLEVIFEGTVTE